MWIWLCRADSLFLIQAKIKRSGCTERKTTLQIVDLHERSPEICKNKIKSTGFFCNLIDCTEILKFDRQNVLSKALLCQTLTRLCRFLLIHICCIHMTFTMQAFQPEYFPYIVLFVCVVSVFPVPFRSPCLFFIKIIRVIFACQRFNRNFSIFIFDFFYNHLSGKFSHFFHWLIYHWNPVHEAIC